MLRGEIVVRDLHKSFGETKALDGCSFSASAGEVHAIVGENGSGKSTLAKILSGVLHPDSGEVSVLGVMPRSPIEARRLGIATIFQEILVADEASVAANLFVGADGLWARNARPGPRRRQTAEIMRRLTGVEIDPDAPVGQLPLSVKQWIVIGRAILANPKVLILDESSAALDLDATIRLHQEIRRLRDEGVCVIIVTHRIAELVRITDRATILRDGQTVATLPKAEITEKNLMALMTPQSRQRAARAAQIAPSSSERARVLHASALRLTAVAEPFDFTLGKGEIVGVTGLDGQGQDGFIKALAGIRPAASGLPVIDNGANGEASIGSLADADRLGIAYVSGDRKRDGIFPQLSIYENLALGLYRRNLAFGGWIRRVPIVGAFKAEVVRLSIKTGAASNKITSLSGGNQQKVLIGRAFAALPRVIVLNDPARGVDLGTKRELYEELRKFAAGGGSVVYLSSEIEEFIGFADRVDVFRDDRLSRSLAGAEIDEQPILAAMFGHAPTEVVFETGETVG
ncbi:MULTISPECIES: sugar ABC transporter ATP-binding protein [unclassified Acidisoma]|jgi:ribose transport system ATP-binding protein|uniref:sugar ABC transporter ATP-binding protein n=1 Tax=unclassified Acidisoma TaxID=2634065 RepID=UPI00131B6087|nr:MULTISPECIES: sugar ABC transporter ATP-binding protein [unclassified Acidisoma]